MAVEFRIYTVMAVSRYTRTLWDVCRCPCHRPGGSVPQAEHKCCDTCPVCLYHIDDMESHLTYCK